MDLLRAICPTRDYVWEREECLRKIGIVGPAIQEIRSNSSAMRLRDFRA